MSKARELDQAKRWALGFFIGAALLFLLSFVLPQSWLTGLLQAFAEAAMVGALADWFAVLALFKRVPIPFIARHTEIIPKNKPKIAANLALFVQEKFLDTESIVQLIQKHDPAQKVANWLSQPANTAQLGRYLVQVAHWALDFTEDSAVQNFLRRAVHSMLASVDLSKSAGTILDSLTRSGRHQELLNEGIHQLAQLLDNEATQATIAQGIVDWLKEEYAQVEKMLPSELIGRKGADIAVKLAANILGRVAADPVHPLRARFDVFTADFIERLKTDPSFAVKSEEIKDYLLHDATLNQYLGSLWGELKDWLKRDLASATSMLRQRLEATGAWLGQTLAQDAQLRRSLNENLEVAARAAAPEFATYLTRHIADTVNNWDSAEMSEQIELNIGKDLQFIRINGTMVGGLIGVILYLLSSLAQV